MTVPIWAWAALAAFAFAMLALDLVLLGTGRTRSFRAAAIWSVWWTALGIAFAGVLLAVEDGTTAGEYLTGFVLEKSLSLDNVFVFAVVLASFAVPEQLQQRVLLFGIAGAIVLRGIFILGGGALLHAFHWKVYVFGLVVLATAFRLARSPDGHASLEESRALGLVRRLVPVTEGYHGTRLLGREGGRTRATPLLAALVAIALFDLVFAVDSIPAIFAVTRDTFVVFAANAFSLLGLPALYLVLAGLLERFAHLHVGLALVLGFVGAKMLLVDLVEIPAWVSLAVIVGVLAGAAAASTLGRRPRTYAGGSRVEET